MTSIDPTRSAQALALGVALLGLAPAAGAVGEPEPPSALPPASLQAVWAAVARMENETAAVAQRHPDLFASAPETAWRERFPDAPLLAAQAAALRLGEYRIRVALDVPLGADRVPLGDEALRAWIAGYEQDLTEFAEDWVDAWSGSRHAAPGPALEDQVQAAWPAYKLLATRSLALQFIGLGSPLPDLANASRILLPLASLESSRVLLDELPPAPAPPGAAPLSMEDVLRVRGRVAYALGSIDPYIAPPERLAQEALEAGDSFGALMHTLLAQFGARFEAEGILASRSLDEAERDLRQASARLGELPGGPSRLMNQTESLAGQVLAKLSEGPQPGGGGAVGEAFAWIGVMEALRGRPVDGGSSAPGAPFAFTALAVAAAAGACALRRRFPGRP